jgi:hypothetical protein
MSILLFRAQVETILFGLIGERTLANGAQDPAISFVNGAEQLDESVSVSGLEVILKLLDRKTSKILYDGASTQVVYGISLTQWSGNNYEEAVLRILSAYPLAKSYPIRVPSGLGPTKQCLIEISSSTFAMGDYIVQAP